MFQDPEVPGRFRFVEVWSEGREWFETVCLFCLFCFDFGLVGWLRWGVLAMVHAEEGISMGPGGAGLLGRR